MKPGNLVPEQALNNLSNQAMCFIALWQTRKLVPCTEIACTRTDVTLDCTVRINQKKKC